MSEPLPPTARVSCRGHLALGFTFLRGRDGRDTRGQDARDTEESINSRCRRQPRRILIVKPSSLGDVATAMPVLRGLRRRFPQAHIAWLVANSCADLVRHDSDLNEVILFDRRHLGRAWCSPRAAWDLLVFLRSIKAGKFDWVIDLQGLLRSSLFSLAAWAPVRYGFADAREGARVFTPTRSTSPPSTPSFAISIWRRRWASRRRAEDFTLQVEPGAAQFASQLLQAHNLTEKSFLICVPPTRWKTKLYPARHWRAVVAELSRRRAVVLLGAPGDRELCQTIAGERPASAAVSPVINLSGQTSVSQMVAVIARSGGVICSDSAAKFIAPAVGVGVVALLGPTRVESTGPFVPGRHVRAESLVAPWPARAASSAAAATSRAWSPSTRDRSSTPPRGCLIFVCSTTTPLRCFSNPRTRIV